MHQSQYDFVSKIKTLYPHQFKNTKVLEVGSLDLNGSVRPLFEDSEFTGIDIGTGPGVDIVCEGQKFNADDNYYDTVISCECFEHNPFWLATFFNMWRVCKPNGLVLFTCATTGREPHGVSWSMADASPLTIDKGWNHYLNLTEEDFRLPFNLDYFFSKYEFSVYLHDLRFYGIKHP